MDWRGRAERGCGRTVRHVRRGGLPVLRTNDYAGNMSRMWRISGKGGRKLNKIFLALLSAAVVIAGEILKDE